MGGSFGGAIVKDKLFYFVNGEFSRRDFPLVDSYVKVGVIDTVSQICHGLRRSAATPAQCSAINALLPRVLRRKIPRNAVQDIGLWPTGLSPE